MELVVENCKYGARENAGRSCITARSAAKTPEDTITAKRNKRIIHEQTRIGLGSRKKNAFVNDGSAQCTDVSVLLISIWLRLREVPPTLHDAIFEDDFRRNVTARSIVIVQTRRRIGVTAVWVVMVVPVT